MDSDRAAQLDEVEFMQAMSREGEFSWQKDSASQRISGTLNVDVLLERPLSVAVTRLIPVNHKPSAANLSPSNSESEVQVAASSTQSSAGGSVHLRHDVSHLPPLKLYFEFPDQYPSCQIPSFTLSCQWLNFTQVRMCVRVCAYVRECVCVCASVCVCMCVCVEYNYTCILVVA